MLQFFNDEKNTSARVPRYFSDEEERPEEREAGVGKVQMNELSTTDNYIDDRFEKDDKKGRRRKGISNTGEKAVPSSRNLEDEESRDVSTSRVSSHRRFLDFCSFICAFLMSIAFICGASFVHPYSQTFLNEPFAFWLVGTCFYILEAALEILKRRSKGGKALLASWVGLLGALILGVASLFLLNALANLKMWGGLWIAGSLLNLFVATYEIIVLLKGEVKYLYDAIAVGFAWVGNLLFMSGAAHLVLLSNSGAFICDLVNASGVLISGAVMFFLQSIFLILPLFKGNIAFSIELNRTDPMALS